jgi:hypothetical protein
MDMIHIITYGSVAFWLFVFAILAFSTWEMEKDSGPGVTMTLVVGTVLLFLISDIGMTPFRWMYEHIGIFIVYAALYIIVGSAWGLCKWWFFLHNKADEYESKRAGYQSRYQMYLDDAAKPGSMVASPYSYKEWLDNTAGEVIPTPSRHKADIMMWMWYWPISATWTLIREPAKRAYRWIFQKLVTTYQRMAAAVFGGRFDELK